MMPARRPAVRAALAAPVLLLATLGAAPRPAAKEEAPPPKAEPVAAPVEEAAPLKSNRFDGFIVVKEDVPGVAVSARLLVNLNRVELAHPAPGVAAVVATAALYSGAPGKQLGDSGALRRVNVYDNSLVLELESSTDRWLDDVSALLDALSQPPLDDATLLAARRRVNSLGAAWDMDQVYAALGTRLVPPEPSLITDGAAPAVGVDTAVYYVEEAWSSERMTLVVTGPVEAAALDALVQKHFLVPASLPPASPPAEVDPAAPLDEEVGGLPPGYLAFGQRARNVRPADAVVLAEWLHLKIDEEDPQAADCDVRYLPSRSEPALLAVCLGVQGSALDVRETLNRALDPRLVLPLKPGELASARKAALARLQADHVSSRLLADRMARWSVAGADGGAALERSVAATTDASLQQAAQMLLTPERSIRVRRVARVE